MGTRQRTLEKFLAVQERNEPYCHWDGKKFHVGVESKHLTRSGVKYNKLIRLRKNENSKTEV